MGKVRNFIKARKFVRSLKLKSVGEWYKYLKLNTLKDIPSNPSIIYKNQGWENWGDWLGTGTVATNARKFKDFKDARKFVHTLNLQSGAQWNKYCKGEIAHLQPKPKDIPANPQKTYDVQGWKNWGDWLGTGFIANFKRTYRSFSQAKQFVKTLNLSNLKQWNKYCNGEIAHLQPKPDDIPANPNSTYKNKGWKGYGDWLGTGRIADQNRIFIDFELARKFAHTLRLTSAKQWFKYCKGEIAHLQPKPKERLVRQRIIKYK